MQRYKKRLAIVTAALPIALWATTFFSTPAQAAAIAFRSSAVADNTATGDTSFTVNKPAGVVQYDVMVAQITFNGGNSVGITEPSNWILANRKNNGNVLSQAIYWKVAGASEPADYTWTFDVSKKASGGILAYSGVDNTTPLDVAALSDAGNDDSLEAPGLTTTTGGAQLLTFYGIENVSTLSQPTGMTERYEHPNALALLPTSSADDEPRPSAGPTLSRTSTASLAEDWVAQSLALRNETDVDSDGVPGYRDNCPTDANTNQANNDNDAQGDACDSDDDNDTYSDTTETNAGSDPFNANSTPEVCDGIDNDLNDGVDEGFTNTDGDGDADCVDTDDDNDTYSDTTETNAGSDPLNDQSTPEVCDGVDNDLNDGVDEGFTDTDNDGDADCVDTDDDDDTFSDTDETNAGSDPLDANSTPEVCDGVDNDLDTNVDEGFTDTDNDGDANCVDTDDDNDTFSDTDENNAGSDPLNDQSTPEVCDGIDNDLNDGVDEGFTDTDNDGDANCVDTDDDDDTFSDTDETNAGSDPLDDESTPESCDGVDNDLDTDVDEGFTNTDGEGAADCIDTDDDNDGFSDTAEANAGSDPLDDQSTPEVCDGDDNDGNDGVDEGFTDTDNDGVANCVDTDDDDDDITDADEAEAGSDPLDDQSTPEVCDDGIDNDLNEGIDEGCDIVGGKVFVKSKVTIKGDGTPFKGKVVANVHRCETLRMVKVFKKEAGPDKSIGQDITNGRGKWSITHGKHPKGNFYAKAVKKKFEKGDGTLVICQPDISSLLKLP
jgi:hypothetical protein